MRKLLIPIFVILMLLFLITPQTFAECKGDFDCDRDVDGADLADFAADYGRTDCPACIPAPVEKTGQTITFASGDDGNLQMGVEWPDPRFTDNADGTVTDNLTGLIWLMRSSCTAFFSGDVAGQNPRTWADARAAANSLSGGYCGLSDGSSPGDWRLPNVRELHSVMMYGVWNPLSTHGHPFSVEDYIYLYWSSTSFFYRNENAWTVDFPEGQVRYYPYGLHQLCVAGARRQLKI